GRAVRGRSSDVVLAHDELGLHRQLVPREAHGLTGERLGHAGQLEHHAARLDHRDPALGRALAGAHAGLGGLLGHGLVGIDVDPDLAATLDLAGHRDSGGLDLAVGEPTGLERLDPVLAELDLGLAARQPGTPAAVLLAVLDALRGQHLAATSLGSAAASAATAPTAASAATATAAAGTARPAGPTRAAGSAAAAASATAVAV